MKKYTRKQKKGYNYHHLRPRSRGGQSTDENMLFTKILKHNAYHRLFGNATPDQIIKMLKHFKEDMLLVFGTTSPEEAAEILIRLMQFKNK